MSHRRSLRVIGFAATAAASMTLAVSCLLLAAGADARRPARPVRAHAAGVLNVRDEGHLRFVHASGSTIIDEGYVSGSFPGSVRVRFVYDGEPDVSAQFTIIGHGGAVSARGNGRLSSPTSPSPSFSGHMTITGGSGRYAHIRGGGELYGVYYRRSYALTVQAIGQLPY
jgi:hypothetical protein